MRFLTFICGIVVLLGAVAEAQEPTTPDPSRVPFSRRTRGFPQPANPNYPDPPPVGQNTTGYAPVQPQVQPAPITPGNQAPGVAAKPAFEAPLPENLPPPTPAQVTYRDGMLTVQAMNSTLAGLLTAIRNKTGIQFEGLEAGVPERVAISIGPAPESEVLAAILAGSKFDYVVLNRPDSPAIVQRVLLTPRGGAPALAGSPPPARVQNDDEEEEQAATEAEPQDTPARPPLSQVQTPETPPNQKTTPEQLLERLKQMTPQQQSEQQQAFPQNQAPIKSPRSPQ